MDLRCKQMFKRGAVKDILPSSPMATAVLLPSGRRHPYPQSILQHHPSFVPTPKYPQRALMSQGGSRSPNRRIRFAPLPDPRRSVLITDDGNELPLPQASSATHFPAPPTPSPSPDTRIDYFSTIDCASLSSSSSDSKRHSDLLDPSSSSSFVSTSGTATPVSITTTTPSEYDASVPPSPVSMQCTPSPLIAVSNKLSAEHNASVPSPSRSRPFTSIFRFKRNSNCSSTSSSTTITPVASIDRSATPTSFSRKNFSAEDFLTLGTINLFRASSSRDTSDCEAGPSSPGWSLTRWTSASSSNSHRHPKEPAWGHPLTRASSTQSYQSKSKATKDAKSNNRSRIPNRKGTRLLNGRYYGVKPRAQNANPFANARDDEPEFVEWGYGGMGSVKGATSAGAHGRWERLHGATISSSKTIDEEEDDGSGMAWIKKRREQKEREKKEKEEKERLEREALEKAESVDTVPEAPLPSATQTTTYLSPQSALEAPGLRDRTPSRPGTASSARTALSASSSVTVTPNQVPTPKASMPTLTIPLPPPPTLVVTPSTSSVPLSSSSATATPCASSATTPGLRAINIPAPAHHYHHRHSRAGSKDLTMVDSSTPSSPSPLPDEKTNSASEDESESDETESDEDCEEDSESDEEQRTRRKTALGAGVEKISRHH